MALTIGSITKKIKSNQQNVKITLNVNPEFEQTNVIKKRLKQNLNKLVNEETNIDSGDIIFKEGEVINIPKKIDDLFDNLLYDNYYLYGISINNLSFLNSLLYVIHKDFKFKDTNSQNKFSEQLKINIIKELDVFFKDKKYSKLNFKKAEMTSNIENNNFENSLLHYLSDMYNINLIVLDYYKFSYYCGNNYDSDNNNVIIIKYNDIYLPLIHIFGEYPDNLIYKCIINKLKVNNLSSSTKSDAESIKEEASSTKLEVASIKENACVDEETTKTSLKLKGISSYKLSDLQQLAKDNNIDILTIQGKKKTKLMLYNELN